MKFTWTSKLSKLPDINKLEPWGPTDIGKRWRTYCDKHNIANCYRHGGNYSTGFLLIQIKRVTFNWEQAHLTLGVCMGWRGDRKKEEKKHSPKDVDKRRMHLYHIKYLWRKVNFARVYCSKFNKFSQIKRDTRPLRSKLHLYTCMWYE